MSNDEYQQMQFYLPNEKIAKKVTVKDRAMLIRQKLFVEHAQMAVNEANSNFKRTNSK